MKSLLCLGKDCDEKEKSQTQATGLCTLSSRINLIIGTIIFQQYSNRFADQQSGQLNFGDPSLTPDSRTHSLPSTHRSVVNPSHGTITPPPNLGHIRQGQTKVRS